MEQALILVGGRGTRLGSLTKHLPKPMMEIDGRPFVEILIQHVARHKFSEIILLCGYLSKGIYSAFHGKTLWGARITCLVERDPMGTGGALLQAKNLLKDQFLLVNGDSFFDFNLLDLNTVPVNKAWLGKMALRPLLETGRYGTVTIKEERVTAFSEKSTVGPGLVNGGVYIFKRAVLDYIQQLPCSLERDVLPKLAERGQLFGRSYHGYFIDIGVPQDLLRARADLKNRNRPVVFFDRDGVLNHDEGYTYRINDFKWIFGAINAIKRCNDRGWFVIVVTNQSGIARGFYDESAVEDLHEWMQEELKTKGAHIDAFYYCPHHPEGVITEFSISCGCRKPEPGMLIKALSEWPIDISRSALIGDKQSDIDAASRVGIRGMLYQGQDLLGLVDSVTCC